MDKLDLGNKGAGIVGGAIGAIIGLAGGPIGSITGAMAGSLAADVCKDVAARVLSSRERMRLDSATQYVQDGIQANIDAGLLVRQDDFFQGEDNFSSDAAQLLEGVLLKCKAQYQEKKVRLIANLFKNVAYNEAISAQTAYQILDIVDGLTFHQLCLISYYGRVGEFQTFPILNEGFYQYEKSLFSEDTWAMAQMLLEFFGKSILESKRGNTFIEKTVICPTDLQLAARGKTIYKLLELQQILFEDVEAALSPIKFQPAWGLSRAGTLNGVKPLG